MMIQGGIDPPQIVDTLDQVDQLIDPCTNQIPIVLSDVCLPTWQFQRKLSSQFSGTCRLSMLLSAKGVVGSSWFPLIRIFNPICFSGFLSCMSPSARFKRALVTLLLELARLYGLTLSLNRDSQDDVVKLGFRRVMLRAHPDKSGGSEAATPYPFPFSWCSANARARGLPKYTPRGI